VAVADVTAPLLVLLAALVGALGIQELPVLAEPELPDKETLAAVIVQLLLILPVAGAALGLPVFLGQALCLETAEPE
jgi:hypothetical protein